VRCREFSPCPAFLKRIRLQTKLRYCLRLKYPTRPWSLTTASPRKACLPKIITPSGNLPQGLARARHW
jgi:hypothetical protein